MVNLFLTGHQDNSVVKNSLQQMALGEKNRWKKVKVLGIQSWPTLCHQMDYSPSDSSVHAILQERILEWVATPFSREN